MDQLARTPKKESPAKYHRRSPPREVDVLKQVVSRLEEDIVLGRLHPRERLIEDDLIERFQIKRHVARKALVELEHIGVVERIPNRGALVRIYGADEIDQLYVLRILLETQAARLIPLPLPDADLADIKRAQAAHDAAVDAHDLGRAFHTNVNFHRVLFAKTGNPYLVRAINDFALRTHGIHFYCLAYPQYLAAARREHHEMIQAIETCDRRALVALCRKHLHASRQCYELATGVQQKARSKARSAEESFQRASRQTAVSRI